MGDIVCKFGGSSVAEAGQIRKIESLIRSDPRRRYIVVSAPGSRDEEDRKITDLLYICQSLSTEGRSFEEPFKLVSDRYLQIDRELEVHSEVLSWLEEVRGQLAAGASADLAASRGEYLCARLLADYLKGSFVDAREIIRLKGNAADSSSELIAARLAAPGLYVIPGFYGADSEDSIRTFSRGGSDITGALVAEAVHAEVYENWTDVSGLLMADPKIVRDPLPMAEVTYREIRELSFMGTQVLHEEAILPVYSQKIPIHIRNTNRPQDAGTIIRSVRDSGLQSIAGVAGRNGFGLLYLEKFLLRKFPLCRSKVFEILRTQSVDWEQDISGIDSLAVLLRDKRLGEKKRTLEKCFEEEFKPDHLEILDNMSAIAVVGEGLSKQPGIMARILLRLSQQGIQIPLIEQGSSKITALFIVHSEDYSAAVRTIYEAIAWR